MQAVAVWRGSVGQGGCIVLRGRLGGGRRRQACQSETQHFVKLGQGGGEGDDEWLEVVLSTAWVVLHGSRRECRRQLATGELVWGLYKKGTNWCGGSVRVLGW